MIRMRSGEILKILFLSLTKTDTTQRTNAGMLAKT